MSRFNLIDEKWIPVRFPDRTREELGIRDTLLRAKEITAIEDSSPLVVASLHRFLLAVLYRALEGPTDIDQAKELFKAGLPRNRIADYLTKSYGRFWLFDDKNPFAQVPSVPDSEIEPWTKLTAECNATTNKVLFDHTDTRQIDTISPAAAARWIVATLTFSVRGGRGYRPSPSSDGVMCVPVGDDLDRTLLLSLVPYPNRMVMETDFAIWERESKTYSDYKSGLERTVSGFADLYSWQARAMRLLPAEDARTAQVAFVPGIGCIESELRDPMVPYYATKKGGFEQIGWEDRGLWRSFGCLLPDADSSQGLEPRVVNHLASLSRSKLIGASVPLLVIAQKFKNAAIEFWRMEQFKLPLDILLNRSANSAIREHLKLAEEVAGVLENALREVGKALIARGDRSLMPDKRVLGKIKPGDVTKYIRTVEALPSYWSALEYRFHEVLEACTVGKDLDVTEVEWRQAVRDELKDAWGRFRDSLSMGDAWAIRAIVKAESRVFAKVKVLDATIADFKKSHKEDA